jgi:hypothetical protein
VWDFPNRCAPFIIKTKGAVSMAKGMDRKKETKKPKKEKVK